MSEKNLGNNKIMQKDMRMSKHSYKKGDPVVALDIGTTKICAIVGRRNEHDRIEIMGYGKTVSTGVLRGVVSNIDKTVDAIKQAVKIAEKNAGVEISAVHVGIAGQHIKSKQHRGILIRQHPEQEISQGDIDNLVKEVYKLSLGPATQILHVIPQEYTVDDEQGIVDPIGMSGNRLEANFHIITGQIAAFNNIHRCVERAGLEVLDMTLEPIASAAAVLHDDEMEAGVALVDIGGGTTDLTIIHENIIRHTAVIPFGGHIITKDIKQGCSVMQDQAEKLKVRFGSALASEIRDNRIITIPGFRGKDSKEISETNLALIIESRVTEILKYVEFEIKRSGYDQALIGGIALTGGGSLLKNIDKLASYITRLDARVGSPDENLAHGYNKDVGSPIYATAIGLIAHAIEHMEENVSDVSGQIKVNGEAKEVNFHDEYQKSDENNNTMINKWTKGLKNWFEAKQEVEF